MGLRNSKTQPTLRKNQIDELLAITHFTHQEIVHLYEHFTSISESIHSDGVIDQSEFQQALGLKDNVIARRIFSVFDKNGDGVIEFREFVCGLSVFCPKATLKEKLKFSFRIYDFDGDGYISKNELYEILKASLFDNFSFHLSEDQLRLLVDQTFSEADTNGDGKISYKEYKVLAMRHPQMLKQLTIDTSQVLAVSPSAQRKSQASTTASAAGSPPPASLLLSTASSSPSKLQSSTK